MKTSKIILFLTALSLLSFQGFSQNWQLVWQDEFNGSISNDWVFETGAGGWGNNELQYYRKENASVQNGQLVISAKREAFGGSNYTSVRMKTQGKKSWKYGKIEARIAMPAFNGIWPAFWMLGDNISSVGWPSCGEIDIMEHVNAGSTVYGTIHWADNGNAHAEYSGNTTTSALTAYHTYTVEWTGSSIKWFVDGNKYHEANIANGVNGTSELHNNFFILLNLAVGGNWPGFNVDNGQFPANMYVDYVRVYQDNGNPVNPNPQPGGVATVYKDCNYGGTASGLPAGDYNYGALYAKGVGNEDISSLKVNSGYEVQLFEHDNFTGSSITFGGDNSCLVASGWNDRTTSLKIRAVSSAFTKTIQAESYSAMAGVQVETTTDAGGGQNVGYIDNGDWMAYNTINFPTSGTYKVEYRVASQNGGNRLSLDLNAGTIQLGGVNIPSTGGWQNWTTVSHNVNINAGTYNVGVFAAIGGFNINWIRFTKVNARMDTELADEAVAQDAVTFFPNPTEGSLTISLAGGLESATASISDVYGNHVKTAALTSTSTVDVSELAAGVYILSVTTETGTTTKRFIKK